MNWAFLNGFISGATFGILLTYHKNKK